MAAIMAASLAACTVAAPRTVAPTVTATAETQPVGTRGDAADDPAIWVNAAAPGESLVIGTDKKGGLAVYRLDGSLRQFLPIGRVNNVDVRDGFPLGGRTVPIVTASDRDRNAIVIYTIAPDTLELVDVTDGVVGTNLSEIYGLCMYVEPSSGRHYVFVNDKDGRYQQHELEPRPAGRVGARLVREFRLGGQPEGCAADDVTGWLYVGEETRGFFRVRAAADAPAQLELVDEVGTGHLVADVEGIAIHAKADGTGYIVVSSQGDDAFAIYARAPGNAFVGRFRVTAGAFDGVSGTDGLDVTSAALPAPYEHGLLVVQDDANTAPRAPQNFKLVPWRDVQQVIPPRR